MHDLFLLSLLPETKHPLKRTFAEGISTFGVNSKVFLPNLPSIEQGEYEPIDIRSTQLLNQVKSQARPSRSASMQIPQLRIKAN